MKMDRLTIKFY